MTQTERSPHAAADRARSPFDPDRGVAWVVAGWLLPGVALFGLYVSALDFDHAWTDVGAIRGRTMIRPPEAIAEAFLEPLHRIPGRGAASHQTYYRPLQVAALSWVDARFGSEPRPFRVAGLAFGALSLGAFAAFARRLGAPAWAALAAALVVALHPVGIEAYVWIAGGSAAMCALFVIASLATGLAAATRRSPWTAAPLGLVSLAALLAGVLSKESAVVAPALLLAACVALAFAPAAAGGFRAPLDRRRAAVLIAVQLALVCGYYFFWRPRVLGVSLVEFPLLGGGLATHLASAVANWPGRVAWLLLPLHSSTSDVIRVVGSAGDPRLWLGIALALGSLLAFALCLRRGRPLAALGIAWIWIAYAPTANLVPQLHANGERYWFLSSFGVGLIVADLAAMLRSRTGAAVAAAAVIAALVFLGQRTAVRLPDWESHRGLFEIEMERHPAYREAYFLVALDHFEQGRLAQAQTALAPLVTDTRTFDGTASYVNPLSVSELDCSIAVAQRRYDDVLALEDRLQRTRPDLLASPSLRTCIGQGHRARGDVRRAVELFRGVADELGAQAPPPLPVMIASAYLDLGELDDARIWLERARTAAGPDAALQRRIRTLAQQLASAADAPEDAP